MDTKTLEQRIRDRATEELRKEATELLNQVRGLASQGYTYATLQIPGAKDPLYVTELMGKVLDSIMESVGPKRGDKAVEDFLAKVENFSDQLEELRYQQEVNE